MTLGLTVWLAAGGLGYLLGSIPTAYLAVRYATDGAVDIRRAGDANAGANNVNRICGRRWSIAVGAVDIGKGLVAVVGFNGVSHLIAPASLAGPASVDAAFGIPPPSGYLFTLTPAGMLAGVAAMAGQIWPVWLRFHGGRGAATALGITGAVLPVPILLTALPCLAVLLLTRSTIIALPFIYLTATLTAGVFFGAGWYAIGYCLGVFVAVGAVHFWGVRFRRPDDGNGG